MTVGEEDFKRASPERTQRIDIAAFVDGSEMTRASERPYFVEPAAKSEKAYALLREAMKRSGKVGIASVVLRARQHLAALIAQGRVLTLELLRYRDELRDPSELRLPDEDLRHLRISEAELKMAERLIEELGGPWRPEQYKDEYRDELLAFIEAKANAGKGHARARRPHESASARGPCRHHEPSEEEPGQRTPSITRADMGLAVYRSKRRFHRTPEPRGTARRGGGSRVSPIMYKTRRTRLHYDFRLELGGVLLSWAVPKGPSLDPHERRLAVHVEDHPLEYGAFEGEIPKGEYGGGTVQLWDRGHWIPEGDAKAAFGKGRLKFKLNGRKLRGGWTLVQMRGPAGQDGKNWLLIKENDAEARPLSSGDILEERPESVAGSGAAKFPVDVQPQLATLAARVPNDKGWIHEIKFDGYRILASVQDGKATLRSRRGNDWTARFGPVATALGKLAAGRALVDGELVALDEKGRSNFQELQNALTSETPTGSPTSCSIFSSSTATTCALLRSSNARPP